MEEDQTFPRAGKEIDHAALRVRIRRDILMVVIAIPFISGDCGTDQVGPRSVKVTRNSEKIGLFYDLSKMHTAFRLRRPDRVNSAGERQQFSSTSKHKLTTRQSRSKAIRIASSSCRIFSIEGAAVLSYNTDGLAATGLCDCKTPRSSAASGSSSREIGSDDMF